MPIVLVAVDIGALLAALLLLVFIAANYPTLYRAIGALLGDIPLIGNWIRANVDALVARMLAAMVGFVNAGQQPLIQTIQGIASVAFNFAYGITLFANQAWGATWQIVTIRIPAAVAAAARYSDAAVAHLAGEVNAELAAARAEMLANFGAAVNYSLQLYRLEVAQAQALYRQALNYTDRVLAAAVATLYSAIGAVRSEALAGIAESEALARLLSAQDRAYSDAGTTKAVGHADAVGQAGRVYTDQRVGTAEATSAASDAQLALTIAAGLTAAQAAITAIEDSPCMQACDVLGGLGAALEGIDAAVIFALIAAGMRDPHDTAAELEAIVVPALTSAEQLAAGLLDAVAG